MQRLNPGLGLRCAVSTWRPDYTKLSESVAIEIQKNMDMEESGPSEYLVYDRTSLDVVTIVMPEPPTDDSMSGFTDLNREGGTHETDLGDFRYGPRRIERTARGELLIRPRSEAVESMAGWFAATYQDRDEETPDWVSRIRRMQSRWGIFRDPYELWEVDFAWFANDFLQHKYPSDHVFWRTTPIGTISYIDAYDFPIETHYDRARQIVAAGSEFAIVVNVETAEARVFRMSGVERFADDFKIPEWPWFDVPLRSEWTD
jgi:hypothetical protein